jgi:DNA-binding MarR family transcriptional regulator
MKRCSLNEEKIRTEFKLSLAEYNGLLALNPGEHVLCSEFSRRMGLSPSRGSRIIDRLIRRKYIMSRQGEDDRRMVRITLTQKGRVARQKIEDRMTECEQRILQHLSKPQQREMKTNLMLLANAMTTESSHAR